MDEFDEALPHGPYGHPVIAALAGSILLVVAAVIVPRLTTPLPFATLIAGGAVAGLLLWIVALVATVRHSPMLWKLASLAVLIGVGALAGVLVDRQYQAGSRIDPSSFAETEFATDGTPSMPTGSAARGPLSKLFSDSIRANIQERQEYGAALGKFGAATLNSAYMLQQSPGVLQNCAKIGEIRALAEAHAAKRAERQAAIAKAIDQARLDDKARDGVRMMALSDMPGGADPRLANDLATLDATAELCALLAERGWSNAGGYFGFASGGDKAQFDALAVRRSALASEAEKLVKAATERMKAGRELVREALS